MSLRFQLDDSPSPRFEVGEGSVLLLRGWVLPPAGQRLRRLVVELGGQRQEFAPSRDLRLDVARVHGPRALDSGFFLPLTVLPRWIGQRLPLRLQALLSSGERHELLHREMDFVARPPASLTPEQTAQVLASRVVICMATRDPDLRLLRQQVESLRAQTVRDWTCLVQDDASCPDRFRGIQEICSTDPRFLLFRNDKNLGFYRNFAACLARVPHQVPFVALCDQDDRWHPDKLAACLDGFASGVELVYSDMRLTDATGRVLSSTFWTGRRNHPTDLAALLVSNTVTGAASVFRGSLLRTVLPFPPVVGRPFHDHWIACAALCTGRLGYIDRPLQDYTQHGSNVLGHQGVGAVGARRTLAELGRLAGLVLCPQRMPARLLQVLDTYYLGHRQLQLYRQTLRLRLPGAPADRLRALDLFEDRVASAFRLLVPVHAHMIRYGRTTDMAEFWLGLGLLSQRLVQPWLSALAHLSSLTQRGPS
ncbi:MAG: glycosyltransferase [Myxococcales bacterium]|nr:glycosyltransferase [Myxococcota bacterium]MDW8280329.1 glycosyltransferase [Myxococcales bacterium]